MQEMRICMDGSVGKQYKDVVEEQERAMGCVWRARRHGAKQKDDKADCDPETLLLQGGMVAYWIRFL